MNWIHWKEGENKTREEEHQSFTQSTLLILWFSEYLPANVINISKVCGMGIENNGNIYLPFNPIVTLPPQQVEEEVQYAEVHFDLNHLVVDGPFRSIIFLEYGQVFFVNSGWAGMRAKK